MKKIRKVYIIAEAGINHNGLLTNCYSLIDVAKESGCDCVKFQFFKAKGLYPRSAGKLAWRGSNSMYSYDIYNAVESFELPDDWIKNLVRYCKSKRIDFLVSVCDTKDVDFLMHCGMKGIKLPSSAITNIPLIRYCAKFQVPIIMSTGGSTLGEVEEAVRTVNNYHNKLSLLHCSIKYPTKLNECNMGVIETLYHAFPENKIGYSDHTKETSKAAVQAVYLGAEIIEKHITLDKKMKGPDHFFALVPRELKEMVIDIRRAEKETMRANSVNIDKRIYGSTRKIVYGHEHYLRDFCFATIFTVKKIKKGQRISYRDLRLLRPGKKRRGMDPKYIDLFKEYKIYASREIAKEEPISWSKIFNG